MTENIRTATFVGAAVVLSSVAWIARPAPPVRGDVDDSGERFFEPFDPLDATGLEIVTFDETIGAVSAFQVTKRDGRWIIPSHDDYPADAEEHLAEAATSVMDLVKGPPVSDSPADHALYGVVDPTRVTAGATGVGTRVTVRSGATDALADFIIGHEVRDAPHLRYVRVPGPDRVYTAAVQTGALTTRFADWIEDDLLKLDAEQIATVLIDGYSIDEVNQRLLPGDRLSLRRDPDTRQWSLDDLAPGEELITAPISEMQRALDDLSIVDVRPKPEGLGRELRAAEELRLDRTAVSSLADRGYYVVEGHLYSNEGEVVVGMRDGVRYVLRFGEIALGSRRGDRLGGEDEEAPDDDGMANRYLFVMAEFDPALVPEPEYEELPPLPEDVAEAAAAEGDDDPEREGPSISEALIQARERVERLNAERRTEHESTLESGRARVAELNDRFADWYYVIPNAEYERLRLTRARIAEPGLNDE